MSDWRADVSAAREREAATRVFRREMRTPKEDFWHTIRVGMPVALLLILILPPIFRWLF